MSHDRMYEGLGVVAPRDRRDARSIPRATPRRALVARDRDGDDGGDDVGRLALSRAFGEGEEAEDLARDDDDDRDRSKALERRGRRRGRG